MTQLVSYYEEKPVGRTADLDVVQVPIAEAKGQVIDGGRIMPKVVYVIGRAGESPQLVPFAQYDVWSLRERFNEVLRVMNTLGAKTIKCSTQAIDTKRRKLSVGIAKNGLEHSAEHETKSGFDYEHHGAGAPPSDPRPLRWPGEPGLEAAIVGVLLNGAERATISV